jgi:hypothetical protein
MQRLQFGNASQTPDHRRRRFSRNLNRHDGAHGRTVMALPDPHRKAEHGARLKQAIEARLNRRS